MNHSKHFKNQKNGLRIAFVLRQRNDLESGAISITSQSAEEFEINMEKLYMPTLSLGIDSTPTQEGINFIKAEAMAFPPGNLRVALLNEAKRMKTRMNYLNDLDDKDNFEVKP